MEVPVELVKVVARSFYEQKYAVLLDYLLRERMLSDDVLAERMQLQVKDVAKLAAKLREDRLIKSESRLESKEYDDRTYTRTYYYIDFAYFADVVKYRLHMMRKTLEDRIKNDINEKGYHCPRCKKTYSVLEAVRLVDPQTSLFHCEVCSGELQSMDASMLSLDTGRQSRLVEQTNYILRLLKKMDDMQIPRFNPVEYLKSKESVEISASSVESTGEMLRAKSPELKVAGADSKSTEIQVEILSGRASTSDRQKHEMPIWHTHSTVTGQAVREKSSSITISHGISSAKQEESIDYQKYYEAVPLQPVSVKRSKIEDAPLIESSESIIPSGTAPLVPVGGTLKSIHEITDEDKNNMTEEEYQKYYEVFMSLEQEDQ